MYFARSSALILTALAGFGQGVFAFSLVCAIALDGIAQLADGLATATTQGLVLTTFVSLAAAPLALIVSLLCKRSFENETANALASGAFTCAVVAGFAIGVAAGLGGLHGPPI